MSSLVFPPPEAFGLPYQQWRPDQFQAFQVILDSPERFIGLTMPTGSGKSLAYMAAMVIGGGRGVALTSTKGLQDQLSHDFPQVYDLRGQRNYPCLAIAGDNELAHLRDPHGEGTCDEGPCHSGVECTLRTAGCVYFDRVRIARESQPVLSMNYAAWFAHRMHGTPFPKPDLLVLDEAHQAVDELSGALTISLDKSLLDHAGIHTHPDTSALPPWKDWAVYHGSKLRKRMEGWGKPQTIGEMKTRRKLKQVERVLAQLADIDPANWVEDHTVSQYRWEVLNPARYAEGLLFQGAKKVVFTSATLNLKTLSLLGVKDEVRMWECPSRFPVQRRPVIHVPTCQVDSKMKPYHWDQWMNRIDGYLSPRGDRKGIIHTTSYKRRDVVLARSQFNGRMVTHESKDLVARVLAFKKQQTPATLVSPAVVTGWDFPHHQCRFQILAKVPFPDTRNKVLKARSELDPDYVPYLTMQALVQAVGRGMRAEDDWCESIIIDDHFQWFLPKYRKLAPKWFLDAVTRQLTLPKPLVYG